MTPARTLMGAILSAPRIEGNHTFSARGSRDGLRDVDGTRDIIIERGRRLVLRRLLVETRSGDLCGQGAALSCDRHPLAPILPRCVRVTSAAQKTVDGVTEGELRSEKGEKEHFHQRDDGFACVRSRGSPHKDLSGVSGTSCAPLGGPRTLKMARPPHNSGRHIETSET